MNFKSAWPSLRLHSSVYEEEQRGTLVSSKLNIDHVFPECISYLNCSPGVNLKLLNFAWDGLIFSQLTIHSKK